MPKFLDETGLQHLVGLLKQDSGNSGGGDRNICQNLTEVFASEIANFDNPWAWIKSRITDGDFTGIRVGDYIPLETTKGTYNMVIAGINPYKNYGDGGDDGIIGNHIDFVSSREWYDSTFRMNRVNFNNGANANEKSEWRSCEGFAYLNSLSMGVPSAARANPTLVNVDYTNSGILSTFPEYMSDIITEKRMYTGCRYNTSSLSTNENSAEWKSVGKLWLPTEREVFGNTYVGGNSYMFQSLGSRQYELFMKGWLPRGGWMTMTAAANTSTNFVRVAYGGYPESYAASSYANALICFRIAA